MRQLTTALLLAAATLSCTKTDLAESEVYNKIEFCVSLHDTTKATKVYSAEEMQSIGLYAHYHTSGDAWSNGTSFSKMNNEELLYNSVSAEWEYQKQVQFWDYTSPSDRYSFVGYSPYGSDENGLSPTIIDGELSIHYDTPQLAAWQPDLMVATPRLDMSLPLAGVLTMEFSHALACIEFMIQGDSTESTIERVVLKGFCCSADLRVDSSGEISWSEESVTQDFEVVIMSSVTPSDTPTSLIAEDGYLMMIPQSIEDLSIEVTFLRDGAEVVKEFLFNSGDRWLSGCHYSYIIDTIMVLDENPSVEFVSEPNAIYDAHYIIHEIVINSSVSNWTLSLSGAGDGAEAWAYLSKERTSTDSDNNSQEILLTQKHGLWSYDAEYNVTTLTGSSSDEQSVYLFLRENMDDALRSATLSLSYEDCDDYRAVERTISQLPVEWIEGEPFGIERIEDEPTELNYGFYATGTVTYEYSQDKVDENYSTVVGYLVKAYLCYQYGYSGNFWNPTPNDIVVTYSSDTDSMSSESSGVSNTYEQYLLGADMIESASDVEDYYDYSTWSGSPSEVDIESIDNFVARYVSMKNADLDNSGELELDEIVWYIPAKDELDALDGSHIDPAYPLVDAIYWSSTAGTSEEIEYGAYARNIYSDAPCTLYPRTDKYRKRAFRVRE